MLSWLFYGGLVSNMLAVLLCLVFDLCLIVLQTSQAFFSQTRDLGNYIVR